MNESRHTYARVPPHIWLSHFTHINESHHIYKQAYLVLVDCTDSRIWLSHVAHMMESRHIYTRVPSHIWLSHFTHMNESHHTYKQAYSVLLDCIDSRIWLSHGTHMYESHHTYKQAYTALQDLTDSHICMSYVTHTWANLIATFKQVFACMFVCVCVCVCVFTHTSHITFRRVTHMRYTAHTWCHAWLRGMSHLHDFEAYHTHMILRLVTHT